MTCIVGLVHDGEVFIGGDSAGVADWNLTIRTDQKVFSNGPFIFGFTTSYRMGQLLRYSLEIPGHPALASGKNLEAYMVKNFVDAVRECLQKGGFAEKDKEAEKGGEFLVGVRGRLFTIHDDYQVGEPKQGFYAMGTGAQVAMGSLWTTAELNRVDSRPLQIPPTHRVMLALNAAEQLNIGVRGPHTVIHLASDA